MSKTQEERDYMKDMPYASAIGSIMYAILCTRPDMSYAPSAMSKVQFNPGNGHWVVIKNILMYLRSTKDMFLVYGERDLDINLNQTTYIHYAKACFVGKVPNKIIAYFTTEAIFCSL